MQIEIDRERLNLLKEAYAKAVKAGQESFKVSFPGAKGEAELHTDYAKHMIAFVEAEFAKHPDQPRRPNNEGEEGQ